MRHQKIVLQLAALALSATSLALPAPAADVTLTANDALGASSFDSAGNWSNAAPPSAGNNYFTNGFLMRTPPAAGDKVFAGDSLTVNGSGPTFDPANLNNAFIFKGPVAGYTATVNNMILDRAYLRHGEGTATTFTLAGNLNIAPAGGGIGTQGGFNIASAVSGSGPLRIAASGNTDTGRVVIFSSGANTYTGSIELVNATQSRFRLADTGLMNFTIGASGVNNSVFGTGVTEFNGAFDFDLSGAGANVGDTWQVVANSTLTETFGSTFSVIGFSDNGNDTWSTSANNVTYTFDETTGALSVVPEPASLSLLSVVILGTLSRRRR